MTELFHMYEKILHVIKCMEKKFTHMTKYDFISSFLFSSITWIALMTGIYLPSELKIEPDLKVRLLKYSIVRK